MLCDGNSDHVPVCHPGVMSMTQIGTPCGSERGRGYAVSDWGGVIHVGSVSASAADRQREDRHHGMDEDCLIRIKMVSGPKYERA